MVEQGFGGDQEAWGAYAALQGGVLEELLLHRVQALGRGETLDGADFLAVGLDG